MSPRKKDISNHVQEMGVTVTWGTANSKRVGMWTQPLRKKLVAHAQRIDGMTKYV